MLKFCEYILSKYYGLIVGTPRGRVLDEGEDPVIGALEEAAEDNLSDWSFNDDRRDGSDKCKRRGNREYGQDRDMNIRRMEQPSLRKNWIIWSRQFLEDEPSSIPHNLLLSSIFATISLLLVVLFSRWHITMIRVILTSMWISLKNRWDWMYKMTWLRVRCLKYN